MSGNYMDRVLCCFNLHHTQSKCPRKFLERPAPTRLTSVLVILSIIFAVPSLYPVCTLVFPLYTFYAHCMYPLYILYVPCRFPLYALCMYPLYTLYVPSIYTLYALCMYPLYTLYVPCMYPLYTLYIPCMYLPCMYVPCMYSYAY